MTDSPASGALLPVTYLQDGITTLPAWERVDAAALAAFERDVLAAYAAADRSGNEANTERL